MGFFLFYLENSRVSVSTSLLKSVALGTSLLNKEGRSTSSVRYILSSWKELLFHFFWSLIVLKKKMYGEPSVLLEVWEPGDDLVLFFSFLLFSCTAWQLLDPQGRPNNLILTFRDFTI